MIFYGALTAPFFKGFTSDNPMWFLASGTDSSFVDVSDSCYAGFLTGKTVHITVPLGVQSH